jgi:hypothetical protein
MNTEYYYLDYRSSFSSVFVFEPFRVVVSGYLNQWFAAHFTPFVTSHAA